MPIFGSISTIWPRRSKAWLAEEVESLGRSDLRRARSQLRRIIEHLLKLQHSPAIEPRDDWLESILDARQDIDDYLTPSKRPEIEGAMPADYAKARAKTVQALALRVLADRREHGEPVPEIEGLIEAA